MNTMNPMNTPPDHHKSKGQKRAELRELNALVRLAPMIEVMAALGGPAVMALRPRCPTCHAVQPTRYPCAFCPGVPTEEEAKEEAKP